MVNLGALEHGRPLDDNDLEKTLAYKGVRLS